ncbi:dihydrodipicolinate synthetase family protein [Pochonia chlamydosporia 170]|uniref:Dihydrodipicolinate synthetase family protein n=1 Tax=Pochonia chlamydosporia 170 TaxID=1380566 RepID=A0A179FI83_METCM|nr:dihydrodipicolinate synthetase family protein [Pochonia chlamydosporia 170]OAQ65242.1 dihydrodipicolinate synthetase family protein [Pochonia chlamydosporia 170]
MPKPLRPGIYAPTQVFYKTGSDEHLDEEVIGKHAVRLVKAGIAGIVTNGSNGEAVYLSDEERLAVTRITRAALNSAGFSDLPIIVGASDQSIQGTIRLCEDAADAGGDAVLVMVPSFFKWAMDKPTIEDFFVKVADKSPLPVIIYNYPGAVAGIDLDSDQLIQLAEHPNIIGTKFTCGSVGKLARVAEATSPVSEAFKSSSATPYFAFSGVADFITPSVEVGGSGAIVGAANVFPRACVNAYNLAVRGKREDAMKAQLELAKADWELTKRAVPGFKAILEKWFGYGGIPRGPMRALDEVEKESLFADVAWMMEVEARLESV